MESKNTLIQDVLRFQSACILVTDRDGVVQFGNNASEELLRLSERQFSGMRISELFIDGDLTQQRVDEVFDESHRIYQRDARLLPMHREWYVGDMNMNRITSADQMWLLIEIHLSERHHAFGTDSSEYVQQLAANSLIRGLGHEIKNPLGGLRGAAQLLDMELEEPNLKEYTEVIIKESDRLSSLVDRMMAPNKSGNKQMKNLHQPLESALQLVQIEAGDGVFIKRNYDPSIPDFSMYSDSLHQAFLNLMINAVHAMESSGILEVETRIERNLFLGDRQYPLLARINISDTGPGVPEDIKDKLFLPMVSGKPSGSGLGLGVAQTLVQQHNGLIEYRDDIEMTTFSIYLPILLEEQL